MPSIVSLCIGVVLARDVVQQTQETDLGLRIEMDSILRLPQQATAAKPGAMVIRREQIHHIIFQKGETVQVLTATPENYELYLYSEADKEESAQDYLSALLDWKLKQDDGAELQFEQTEKDKNDLNISTEELPVLVVKEEGKTVTTISGKNPREKILMTLENHIAMVR